MDLLPLLSSSVSPFVCVQGSINQVVSLSGCQSVNMVVNLPARASIWHAFRSPFSCPLGLYLHLGIAASSGFWLDFGFAGRAIDRPTEWPIKRLPDWPAERLKVCVTIWRKNCMLEWPSYWLVGWLSNCLTHLLCNVLTYQIHEWFTNKRTQRQRQTQRGENAKGRDTTTKAMKQRQRQKIVSRQGRKQRHDTKTNTFIMIKGGHKEIETQYMRRTRQKKQKQRQRRRQRQR